MKTEDVLTLIQESALGLDTKQYPNLAQIFITFYAEKDKNIQGALARLNYALGQYQWDNQLKGPDFISKIRLSIKQVQNVRHGVGVSAAMLPIWFGH